MQGIKFEYENKTFPLVYRKFGEFHGLTLVFITMNEEHLIESFIKHARRFVNSIKMVDGGSTDRTVQLARPLVDGLEVVNFNGHFSNQKNNAIRMSSSDWTIVLDPDEKLPDKVIEKIPEFINSNEYDCYSFPRKELLDNKENTKIYPDYQDRLFRTYCRYVRPVHHELVGFKNRCILPVDQGMDIIHSKYSTRHSVRNVAYRYFQKHYAYEQGEPGKQGKDFFDKFME